MKNIIYFPVRGKWWSKNKSNGNVLCKMYKSKYIKVKCVTKITQNFGSTCKNIVESGLCLAKHLNLKPNGNH